MLQYMNKMRIENGIKMCGVEYKPLCEIKKINNLLDYITTTISICILSASSLTSTSSCVLEGHFLELFSKALLSVYTDKMHYANIFTLSDCRGSVMVEWLEDVYVLLMVL